MSVCWHSPLNHFYRQSRKFKTQTVWQGLLRRLSTCRVCLEWMWMSEWVNEWFGKNKKTKKQKPHKRAPYYLMTSNNKVTGWEQNRWQKLEQNRNPWSLNVSLATDKETCASKSRFLLAKQSRFKVYFWGSMWPFCGLEEVMYWCC